MPTHTPLRSAAALDEPKWCEAIGVPQLSPRAIELGQEPIAVPDETDGRALTLFANAPAEWILELGRDHARVVILVAAQAIGLVEGEAFLVRARGVRRFRHHRRSSPSQARRDPVVRIVGECAGAAWISSIRRSRTPRARGSPATSEIRLGEPVHAVDDTSTSVEKARGSRAFFRAGAGAAGRSPAAPSS